MKFRRPSGWRFSLVVLAGFGLADSWSPNYNLPLDRPYTLRNSEPSLIEREHGRALSDTLPLSWVFPRPCISPLDSTDVCGSGHALHYHQDARQEEVDVGLIGAGEYRLGIPNSPIPASQSAGSGDLTYEAGLIASGGKGPLSFYLDAREFSSGVSDGAVLDFDREPVDLQKKSTTGSISFASFSRYRANVALDLPFARVTAGRDAAHWGPGVYTNLTFNQEAVPFNQYGLQTHVGPISVTSLYGDLLGINDNHDEKNLYAHRYEWRVSRDWLLGFTDQIILYRDNRSYFFLPVFPLFIAKTVLAEDNNNGLLSADVTYRIPGFGLLYSEFLLDDLESPSSLFLKNYRENKWGAMMGAQWGGRVFGKESGLVLEASHVEPWVYTHFPDFPAQASNGNYPLGNPYGPNSQAVVFQPFIRPTENLYLSSKMVLLWKGQDSGSAVTDSYSEKDNLLSKTFLNGVDKPQISVSPFLSYTWKRVHVETMMDIQRHPDYYIRLQGLY